MLVSVGSDMCLVSTEYGVSEIVFIISLLNQLIQGQDYCDNNLFSSVEMSNVCCFLIEFSLIVML